MDVGAPWILPSSSNSPLPMRASMALTNLPFSASLNEFTFRRTLLPFTQSVVMFSAGVSPIVWSASSVGFGSASFDMVLGELEPGQLGPRTFGPRQFGPWT